MIETLGHYNSRRTSMDGHWVHGDGHWVHGKELSRDYIGDICIRVHYDKYWCSECNYTVERPPLWKYCPRCGAQMDEGDRK